jgi:tetratricopeptide (TPR) repeat protein
MLIDGSISANVDNGKTYLQLGRALEGVGRVQEAIEAVNTACFMDEKPWECLCVMGDLYLKLDDYDQAKSMYKAALNLKPDHGRAFASIGFVLYEQGILSEAVQYARRAVEAAPDQGLPYFVLGSICLNQGSVDESISLLEKSISLDPLSANSHTALGLARLTKGELGKATWEEYEWRFKRPPFQHPPLAFHSIPRWDGNPVGAKVLVWGEQGIGDIIFGMRYIMHLGLPPSQLFLCTDQRLVSISQRSMPGMEISHMWPAEPSRFGITHTLPLCSGGEIVGASMAQARSCPYLIPDVELVDKYRLELERSSSRKLKVGISWSSELSKGYGSVKSVDLQLFSIFAKLDWIQLVDLQYGNTLKQRHRFEQETGHAILSPEFDRKANLEALSALIMACDCVISVSNVTAHITGSLGQKGFVLLPVSKGLMWYWHRGISVSPWYPSLKLFRQEKAGFWIDELSQVCSDLQKVWQP